MIEFFSKLFRSDFMPHGHCYLWRPELVWLHVISDSLITISYYFIPVALVYFVRKRKDLPFHWMFLMFGIFILGCGTTHLMEIWTLWHGTYRLAGVFKAVTAAASVATAIAFVPLIPRAMALPSPAQLQEANSELAAKSQHIRALSAYHVTRLEEERRHISREVHDESGQALIGIKLALQVLAQRLPKEQPELRTELDDLREQVNQATRRLKELGHRLRPATLDQLGLEGAVKQLAFEHEDRTGVTVVVEMDSPTPRLPQLVEITVYRVAQEALTNVAKHSQATEVSLSLLSTDSKLTLSIGDNGRGFDSSVESNGLGLFGMQERADMLDGKLTITTKPNAGTVISLEVNLPFVDAHSL